MDLYYDQVFVTRKNTFKQSMVMYYLWQDLNKVINNQLRNTNLPIETLQLTG
jgi:hypothetical protein